MTNDLDRISTDLVKSLGHDELADLGGTIGDIALDSVITSGALDGVPVVGTLVNIARSGAAIRDLVFQRKVIAFLTSFANESDHTSRKEFVRKIEEQDDGQRFGETILLLLERMDDLSKPVIVGRLMAATARGDMSLKEGLRLSRIVDRAFIEDLLLLPDLNDGKVQPDEGIADALFTAGLLSNDGSDGGTFLSVEEGGEPGGTIYSRNRYARLLMEFGLSSRKKP
ncbi:hypothetical protein ADU59_01630 (plasmid) [Pararhizobium polonicum]|uniref:DUF4393 domain-containing protein n=1 Tax=Pararhizobium polonicum TaxID=1612624 RepID=A0A1C7P7T1_9HYPH|nr:hypothetical protein [Pararhizobium polonicum]OBZ97302.1 hypothetical protein ADU59_01630 [Pararhizobium polonicum]